MLARFLKSRHKPRQKLARFAKSRQNRAKPLDNRAKLTMSNAKDLQSAIAQSPSGAAACPASAGEEQNDVKAVIIGELRRLHEGVLARYRLRPSELATWKQAHG